MRLFYQSVVLSTMVYNQVCFYNSARKTDTDRLEQIARTAARVTGSDLPTPSAVFQTAVGRKLDRIRKDPRHPLRGALEACASHREGSRRLRSFRARTSRFRDSFLPTAVRFHNEAP